MQNKITPQIAALYLGRKCELEWLITDPDDVFMKGEVWYASDIIPATITRLQKGEIRITPYLRSLKSITEDECRELYQKYCGKSWDIISAENPTMPECISLWAFSDQKIEMPGIVLATGKTAVWLKLLEWGFDLFGLIEAGLAKEI